MDKILELRGNPMRVDTGDKEVDKQLCGYYDVITGYHETIIYRVSN
jgi:predicted polyphosphate/ATP-dependent NAD kinase